MLIPTPCMILCFFLLAEIDQMMDCCCPFALKKAPILPMLLSCSALPPLTASSVLKLMNSRHSSKGSGSLQLKCTQRKLPDLLNVKAKSILTPKTTTEGQERGGSKREHSCLVLICLVTLFGYRI